MDPNQARKPRKYNTITPRKKSPPGPKSCQDRIFAGMTPIAENSAMVGTAKSSAKICLSCHRFRANAFRLLLHSFAYNLVNLFRLQLPLSMRSAQIETLRTQLFKIGARIRETARCIRIHLASGWPFQNLFQTVCNSS
jgi:hypothetical protein